MKAVARRRGEPANRYPDGGSFPIQLSDSAETGNLFPDISKSPHGNIEQLFDAAEGSRFPHESADIGVIRSHRG
jgi:hypothetical protein